MSTTDNTAVPVTRPDAAGQWVSALDWTPFRNNEFAR